MFTYTAEQHVGTEDSDAAPAIEVGGFGERGLAGVQNFKG